MYLVLYALLSLIIPRTFALSFFSKETLQTYFVPRYARIICIKHDTITHISLEIPRASAMREFRQLFDDTVLPGTELLRVQIRARIHTHARLHVFTYVYTGCTAHAYIRVYCLFLKAEKINKQEQPVSVLNWTHGCWVSRKLHQHINNLTEQTETNRACVNRRISLSVRGYLGSTE